MHRQDNLNVDASMTYTLLRDSILSFGSSATICSTNQSSPDFRNALHASPGDDIMLLFQENGHVPLIEQDINALGKLGSGEVFAYGSSDP